VPVFAHIQTTQEQDGDNPAPTPIELRADYWIHIIHGIRGMCWFPFFKPTPAANFQEMSRLFDQSQRLEQVIFAGGAIGPPWEWPK
jgi:hypothetical protein